MKNTIILHKTCSKCKTGRPTADFYKDKRAKDGLTSQCKFCYLNNRDKVHKIKYDKQHNKTIIRCLEQVYNSLKKRCENPTAWNYKNYGGRGIKNLFKSKTEFMDYIMKEIFKIKLDNLQIDRIDNNGNYEPGNIRFVTAKENCNNRRKSKWNIL